MGGSCPTEKSARANSQFNTLEIPIEGASFLLRRYGFRLQISVRMHTRRQALSRSQGYVR